MSDQEELAEAFTGARPRLLRMAYAVLGSHSEAEDESVSFAMMVVLETLSPAERTAWVLHDVFGMSFKEVAQAGTAPTTSPGSCSGPRERCPPGGVSCPSTSTRTEDWPSLTPTTASSPSSRCRRSKVSFRA